MKQRKKPNVLARLFGEQDKRSVKQRMAEMKLEDVPASWKPKPRE